MHQTYNMTRYNLGHNKLSKWGQYNNTFPFWEECTNQGHGLGQYLKRVNP